MRMSPPEEAPLARVQRDFAAHLRAPDSHPAPADVPAERMRVYRDLVYANVASLLASNFPMTRRLLADDVWSALMRDFLARRGAKTPLFKRLGGELVEHLEGARSRPPQAPPFLAELARYEWLETELRLSDEEAAWSSIDRDGDLVAGIPVLSPLARWMQAEWPVHRLGGCGIPTAVGEGAGGAPDVPTCLVLCREGEEEVRFMQVTPSTLQLIEQIAAAPDRRGRDHLERLARAHPAEDRDDFVAGGRRILDALRARGVLLGACEAAAASACNGRTHPGEAS
jgi:hypothetical protein